MAFLNSLLPAAVVLGLLIIIHEFGHFLACRLTGVKVEKFSIGFGPEILHWQGRETRFSLSLLPLGGYVKPAGETVGELADQEPKKGDYLAAPLLSRMVIVVAGVVMNYFLAFVLFSAIFLIGRPVPGTVVGGFIEGYPAAGSGLLVDDKIVSVDGTPVETWIQMTDLLSASGNDTVQLGVLRGQTALEIPVAPKVEDVPDFFGQKIKVRRIGIQPSQKADRFERYGLLESLGHGARATISLTYLTHKAIYYLVMGKLSIKSMAGPVAIVSMSGTAAQLGLPYVMQLAATLSVSLAVINLLPIPALDGGHLFFMLIEAVRRKRVSLQFQERATQAGFVLLMTLLVVVIYNDLSNLQALDKIKNLFGF
ncbi:MAG: RIP metalloprotease RseP [Omnitrophica bacterium GWA2_52_8]|nr:MAG: RIP metalloprotease RseP [Omnitrophica bacterium GWA2_52_8]